MTTKGLTPMQAQYKTIKDQHPDKVVFFRLGDFYEAFNKDAEDISKTLGITLTGRGKDENRIPMAGIPYHALDNYLPKLVRAGFKVAIVEQTGDVKPGALVDRNVTKIYTAGTITAENTLVDEKNNYLVAVNKVGEGKKGEYGVAVAETSTGKLSYFVTPDEFVVKRELARINPAELLISESQSNLRELTMNLSTSLTVLHSSKFESRSGYQFLTSQLKVPTLKGFGLKEENESVLGALAALLGYVIECNRGAVEHFTSVSIYKVDELMALDPSTIRNLELVSNNNQDSQTVFSVLNECQTNMGKRKLYDWLLKPLLKADVLQARWDCGEYFQKNSSVTENIRQELRGVADIERIIGRLGTGSGNARDLVVLKDGLFRANSFIAALEQSSVPHISELSSNLGFTPELATVLERIIQGILPEPAASISEGNMINDGFDAQVDELRELRSGGKTMLAEIQARESSRTGISSLKVSYNNVFGYYIEVTKTHLDKVPDDYIRKQTLTNAERFITQELKEWEDKVLSAEAKLIELEQKLFLEFRSQVLGVAGEILKIADAVAEIDVLTNFGYQARQYNYCKPILAEENSLFIQNGRHPIVERWQPQFTANDVDLNPQNSIVVLTGPNMSGKSTYIRQIALIVLLAQIGSFVPASEMKFSLVDQIFTRIGASDNLARGESTFMVEMHETAVILNNATAHSLIILDEVGRGTGTYDGVAIAWSIVEYVAEKIKAKTLFATHYHELTSLSEKYPQVENYQVEVVDDGGEILFRHKIVPGGTNRSYGIHVAQMAGVPKEVISRAEEILDSFENNGQVKGVSSKNLEKQTIKKEKTSKPTTPKRISPKQLGLI